jgi:hypothetical protein
MIYNPQVPPQTPEELLPYLNEEFGRVSRAIAPLQNGEMEIHYALPAKYKPGMVLYLSGTGTANPLGTGLEGVYRYGTDNLWHYLG